MILNSQRKKWGGNGMNMFQGRYGFDRLSKFLLILAFMFSWSSRTLLLSMALLAVATYRAFSKDIAKRSAELNGVTSWLKAIALKLGFKGLQKYLNKSGYGNSYGNSYRGNNNYGGKTNSGNYVYQNSSSENLKTRVTKWVNEKKNYKILSCPKCGQKLRVPRGKGKITVTCKKCFFEFKAKV